VNYLDMNPVNPELVWRTNLLTGGPIETNPQIRPGTMSPESMMTDAPQMMFPLASEAGAGGAGAAGGSSMLPLLLGMGILGLGLTAGQGGKGKSRAEKKREGVYTPWAGSTERSSIEIPRPQQQNPMGGLLQLLMLMSMLGGGKKPV